ncbi:saccharopine dehydrogenase family protein [Erythrobacter sp.]|uniref:saccharopine dehydrogenase family protein n=1 Tax=Erythrobacter sp. TaxID=1042 RepID=UPI0025DC3651|nr:saccharopine dehydrogenase NADP-binding domain-containing protein [Erythrobacter sp.]
MLRVAIIGGYGNFGAHVARSLASNPAIHLIIAGRSLAKAKDFAATLPAINPAEAGYYDLDGPAEALGAVRPDLVINMVGPYNGQGYAVAEAAIACGAHYCDIADAREFVTAIGVLDDAARDAGVTVLAGASSVPALTAAYCDEAAQEMRTIRTVEYGISGAEQSNAGAGTVAAVLAFVGQRFTHLIGGRMTEVTGWGDLRRVELPGVGVRWFGRANAADLDLFAARYPGLTEHSFWAGHAIAPMHFGTVAMGWLARFGLLPRLDRLAPQLVRIASLFDWLGTGTSGFFMTVTGEGADGTPMTRRHWIIARSGHGPYIPCIPVILIARQLAYGRRYEPGARPCLGVISLAEYRAEFANFDIEAKDG